MKKLISKMLILTICLATLLSGCVDTKPVDWNVGEGTTWEIWAEGTIVSIVEKPASTYWEYSFSTGKTIDVRHIRNPGAISNGQKGILYRNMALATDDKDAWFQWVEEGTIIEEPKHNIAEREKSTAEKIAMIKIIEEPQIEELIKEELINHNWYKAKSIRKLETHEIVLIELDDGIITTGFLTYDRLWKLGINKNSYQGGRTINNVTKWKRLDLE